MTSMKNLTGAFTPHQTPQSEVIPGREKDMSKNNAGGVSFLVDKWTKLNRFLIMGSEGGTFYVSERKLTADNAKSALDCLAEDGLRVVRTVVEVSDAGRAAKNTPALFVLALAAKLGDEPTRKAAFEALPKVARIATQLFQFADGIQAFGGWGRATRRAFAQWYTDRDNESLAYQLVKYQSRDGWSHGDILRLAKPSGHERGGQTDRLLGWATGKWTPTGDTAPGDATDLVWAFERAKAIGNEGTVSKQGTKAIVGLINDHGLPREAIPTQYLNEVPVWEALLDNQGKGMPITALIRNLPKMTSIGLITGGRVSQVADRINNAEVLKRGRVHPLNLLVALRTYGSGQGVRGSLTWNPVSRVVDALDGAFYKAFDAVEPTGKRHLLALDVSGSMSAGVNGAVGLNCREAAAAMAMVTAASEKDTQVIGFTSAGRNHFGGNRRTQWSGTMYGGASGVSELDLSPRRRLDDNVRSISGLPFGGTDCALPMIYAKEKGLEIDVFVVYTDSETWHGAIHPSQALVAYRKATGINAKLIVVGMAANDFSIADPKDAGMLDVVGFDTAAPNIMAAFARGEI